MEGKFAALWVKYLPAIRILLKKSMTSEDQQITLGKLELQSVDSRKNVNFSFSLEIVRGKMQNRVDVADIGRDLFDVLSNDPVARHFMSDKTILMQMARSGLLTFKATVVA